MDSRSRFELAPGIRLDARRAVFLAETGTLAVADLHLGYAWAHRARGNLLPIQTGDETLPRLRALLDDYQPRELVILGDIVHAAVEAEPLLAELRDLAALAERVPLRLLAGNHDTRLARLLERAGIGLKLEREASVDGHLLMHGDEADEVRAISRLRAVRGAGKRVIFGHEHPALALSDGIGMTVRCPCFFAADDALILPAFSNWAAGTDPRDGTFLSAYARCAQFTSVIAILAGKLLPMPHAIGRGALAQRQGSATRVLPSRPNRPTSQTRSTENT
jgi:putative SbcD/Mre11-related phosphoesterase